MSNDTQKKIDNIVQSIEKIKSKQGHILFFVQNTHGNPKGSVAFTYELCKMMIEEGYNASILHDEQYKGVENWLGKEYQSLPHQNVKQNLVIGPQDIVIIPEVLGQVMQQLSNITCIKIVLCQAYDWIFETLQPGAVWMEFGFDKCITVSNQLHDYIHSFFPSVKIDTVSPFISEMFQPSEIPQKPLIAIHSRDQRDSLKIVKSFYTKYPNFRWFGFRDLRGLPRDQFANSLKECCLSVWVDNTASFGTFPLESMTCGIPVIGKIPDKIPEWMTNENGIWIADQNQIIDDVAKYVQYWLEDKVPPTLLEKMKETTALYNRAQTKYQIVRVINSYLDKRFEALNNALTKLKEENKNEEILDNITSE